MNVDDISFFLSFKKSLMILIAFSREGSAVTLSPNSSALLRPYGPCLNHVKNPLGPRINLFPKDQLR